MQPDEPKTAEPSSLDSLMSDSLVDLSPQAPVSTPIETQNQMVPSVPMVAPPAGPYQLPIQPLQHDRQKKVFVILGIGIFVMVIAAVGVSGYMILNSSKASTTNSSSLDANNNEIIKIPAITNAIAAPSGWKSFKSKKLGVSMTVPNNWNINEWDPAKYGSAATGIYGNTISVFNPKHNTGTFDVRVTREKVSDQIASLKASLTQADGYKYVTKASKWQGYTATEVVVTNPDFEQSDGYAYLLVQISDYVFSIPNMNSASIDSEMDSYEEYKQFIASIRVDDKVVVAQAKVDAVPVKLRQGKDTNYGKVAIPAGWKKGTSSKYGISFVMRPNWEISEQSKGLNNGAVLSLDIGSAEQYGDHVTILVTTQGLDEFMNQSTYTMGVFGGGKLKVIKEKMKWHGHEARRVVMQSGLQESSLLFVRAGSYTYMLPDPSSVWKSTADSNGYSQEDYQTLVKSIRITK